jgi:hypothetical protein
MNEVVPKRKGKRPASVGEISIVYKPTLFSEEQLIVYRHEDAGNWTEVGYPGFRVRGFLVCFAAFPIQQISGLWQELPRFTVARPRRIFTGFPALRFDKLSKL